MIYGRRANGDQFFGIFLTLSDVDKQFLNGLGLVHVLSTLHMGRQAGYHTQHGRIGENGHFPVWKHPRIYTAQGCKTEETVLMSGNDKTDLI